MKEQIKLELYRSIKNRMFFISAISAAVFSIGSFVQRYLYEATYFATVNTALRNPSYEIDTIYNQWIGAEGGSSFYYVFYIMLPVFSALVFSWSYLTDEKNGYLRQLATKGKRGNFLIAKYIAVFISGGAAVLFAIIINLCLCAMYFPFITPDVYYDVYYGIGLRSAFCDLFYCAPILYLTIYVIITTLYSGLFAVFSMVCSFYVKNKYITMFIPFFLCIILKFISEIISINIQIVPTAFLHPGATVSAVTNEFIIIGELVLGILLTLGITVYRGRKNDIF